MKMADECGSRPSFTVRLLTTVFILTMCAAPASAAVAPRIVVGLGEILWDVFSDTKRKLGGAPTNFCYHAHALGDRGVVCSRVGNDELGREAKAILDARGVDTRLMQKSLDRPTGRVLVKLSASGSATYEFEDDSAWDALELTDDWKCLAQVRSRKGGLADAECAHACSSLYDSPPLRKAAHAERAPALL